LSHLQKFIQSAMYEEINWLLTTNHLKSYGDVFCTLYLRNPPHFPKPNVYNGYNVLFSI
jgi:hypothetical protein